MPNAGRVQDPPLGCVINYEEILATADKFTGEPIMIYHKGENYSYLDCFADADSDRRPMLAHFMEETAKLHVQAAPKLP